jgi:putative photosynthetic complex assembly protein 2
MTGAWTAIIAAIFIWWFATGAILLAVRRSDRSGGHLRLVVLALPLLLGGVAASLLSLAKPDLVGVYLGFFGALAIWGWVELAFLAGIVTGPMRHDCPPGLSGRPRFLRAFATVVHHEVALTLGLLGLVAVSVGAENRMAVATYLILFIARICAKLNLFFGVPRINLEFVPDRLVHLKSYFRRGPITLAFPAAITILTAMVALCTERLWFAGSDFAVAGYGLLTALAALALLEHWLMVIPLPDAKLWRWMLPAPKTMTKEER